MTKKDYVAIAAAVKASGHYVDNAELVLTEVAFNLADVLAKDNPKFDRTRFLETCGVSS